MKYLQSPILYLIVFVTFLLLLTLLFASLLEPIVILFAKKNFAVCDFAAGGGSINLCNNQILFYTWILAMSIGAAISFIGISLLKKHHNKNTVK